MEETTTAKLSPSVKRTLAKLEACPRLKVVTRAREVNEGSLLCASAAAAVSAGVAAVDGYHHIVLVAR